MDDIITAAEEDLVGGVYPTRELDELRSKYGLTGTTDSEVSRRYDTLGDTAPEKKEVKKHDPKKHKTLKIVLAVVITLVILVAIAVVVYYFFYKKSSTTPVVKTT
ncbi:hypothetical protein [Carp edema virus]|nr:hypothetical protein [Carp edema virus]